MSRVCTVCSLELAKLEEANRLLVSGVTIAEVARMTGCTHAAVSRHKHNHLAPLLAEAEAVGKPISVEDRLKRHQERIDEALAREDLIPRDYIALLREDRELTTLLLKKEALLGPESVVQVAVVQSPEWINLRTALLQALAPYPEAKAAVIEALTKRSAI
jgi:hypothetical protein